MNKEKFVGEIVGTVLGTLIRWTTTIWLFVYLFRENPGVATRIFFVIIGIGWEIKAISATMLKIKKTMKEL